MSPLTIITGTLLIYLVVRGRIGVYADLLKSPLSTPKETSNTEVKQSKPVNQSPWLGGQSAWVE